MRDVPRVAVLLATLNGRTWIEEQVQTIFAQTGVALTLIVSDDGSTDGTREFLESTCAGRADMRLLPTTAPSGSSAANFSRLLRAVDTSEFDYFALADQDDIWMPDKLARACMLMRRKLVEGYSSNVEALYPDGRRAVVMKASPQHRHDHYFESPGPGCSFVLSRRLMRQLVPVLEAIAARGDRIFDYHDWFIYAFARRAGFRWYIDPISRMLYRQHQANVLGANIGLLPRWRRLKKIRSGWYFDEIQWQHRTLESLRSLMPSGRSTLPAELLQIDSLGKRLRFCLRVVPQARRRFRDRLWLWIGVLSGTMR